MDQFAEQMFPQLPHDNDDFDYDFDEVDTKLYEESDHDEDLPENIPMDHAYSDLVIFPQLVFFPTLHIYLSETINFVENFKYHTRTRVFRRKYHCISCIYNVTKMSHIIK